MKPITDENIYYKIANISEITKEEYELVVNA